MILRDQIFDVDGRNDYEFVKFFNAVFYYFLHQKTLNPDTLAKHFLMSVSIIFCTFFSSYYLGSFSFLKLILGILVYIPVLIIIRGNLKEYCTKKIDKRIKILLKSNTYTPFDDASIISGSHMSTVVEYVPYDAAQFHRQYARESMHYVPFQYPQISHSPAADEKSEFGYHIGNDEEMGQVGEAGTFEGKSIEEGETGRVVHDDLAIIVDSPICTTLERTKSKGSKGSKGDSNSDLGHILDKYSNLKVEESSGQDDLAIIVDSPICTTIERPKGSKGDSDLGHILEKYSIPIKVEESSEVEMGPTVQDDLAIIVDSPICTTLERTAGASFKPAKTRSESLDIEDLYDRAARED
jgi:hypothetical protein